MMMLELLIIDIIIVIIYGIALIVMLITKASSDVIILDKNFSKIGDIVKGTNKTVPHDTLYVKIVK